MPPTVNPETIHYLTDEAGERQAAVVPIDVWQEISSWMETEYLLSNPAMRKHLMESAASAESIPWDEAMRQVE